MAIASPVNSFTLSGQWSRLFYLFRGFLLPACVVLGVVLLPPNVALMAVIVGGHAHFLMAYIAQARAGKMRSGYVITAAVTALAFAIYFSISGAFLPIFLLVNIVFAMHFAYDEFTLHDERWTASKTTTLIGFITLFLAFAANVVFDVPWLLVFMGGLITLGVVVRLLFQSPRPSRAEWYLWFLSLLILFMALDIIPVTFGSITNFIVMLHFFNWMIGYGVKVHSIPQRRERYWRETTLTIFIFAVTYALLALWSGPLFAFFFSTSAYFAWAIGHIILSFYLEFRQ